MLGLAVPVGDFNAHAHYRPVSAIHRQVTVAEGGLLPCFGGSGTGGVEGVHFVLSRQGYRPFAILKLELAATQDTYAPYTDLMKEVKAGFGRTMSHLPAVFGVSRQTLYNWLNGEIPKEHHQGRLLQMAAAARVFTEAGFKPTALSLERTISHGKSFVELIVQDAEGKETAERLVRIEKRGAAARQKLDDFLGDRTPSRPDIADLGRPAFYEDI